MSVISNKLKTKMNQMEQYRQERWEKKWGVLACIVSSIVFWGFILSILIIATK